MLCNTLFHGCEKLSHSGFGLVVSYEFSPVPHTFCKQVLHNACIWKTFLLHMTFYFLNGVFDEQWFLILIFINC